MVRCIAIDRFDLFSGEIPVTISLIILVVAICVSSRLLKRNWCISDHAAYRKYSTEFTAITLKDPSNTISAKVSAKIKFLEKFGDRYGYPYSQKGFIDDWRYSEFPTLNPPINLKNSVSHRYVTAPEDDSFEKYSHEVYLDYAGSALPTRSQLAHVYEQSIKHSTENHDRRCPDKYNRKQNEWPTKDSYPHQTHILGNPHSQGDAVASDRTWKLMELARSRVRQHFGISDEPINYHDHNDNIENLNVNSLNNNNTQRSNHIFHSSEYDLVFTSGATESLRHVSERFPWNSLELSSSKCDQILFRLKPEYTGPLSTSIATLSSIDFKRIQSIQFRSLLLYPKNVHTSVIGMRNLVLDRGAQFYCVSIDDLMGASSGWFQDFIEKETVYDGHTNFQSVTIDNNVFKMENIKDSQGDKPESMDEVFRKKSTQTIWIHHLLVLPIECNFGGDRFDWTNTVNAARSSSFSIYLSCDSTNAHTKSLDKNDPNCISMLSALDNNTSFVRVCHKWHVLLDSAKAAATSQVHLPTIVPHGPDFAIVSFYKMFGHPTGLGALFIKQQRNSLQSKNFMLEKRGQGTYEGTNDTKEKYCISKVVTLRQKPHPRHFFGGGSVDVVIPQIDFTVPKSTSPSSSAGIALNSISEEFIDFGIMVHGTPHFRGIVELLHGFQELDNVGGMSAISSHSTSLAAELVQQLKMLHHDTGESAVQIYGQWKSFSDELVKSKETMTTSYPGPTVAFNLCDRDGNLLGYDEVSRLATLNQPPIQLRTGCFCNPGACQDALSLSDSDIIENYTSGHVCGDRRGIVNGKPTGCLRASFGKDSLWEDMDALVSFIKKVFLSHVRVSTWNEHCSNLDDCSPMKIDCIFVFPIKSCAAMRVQRWPIDPCSGRLAWDREYAIVDSSGTALRLHSYPIMSQIVPTIDLMTNTMTVSAPYHDDLLLSLCQSNEKKESQEMVNEIKVCGNKCRGKIWGCSNVSNWFTSVLGIRCWLVRHVEDDFRTVDRGSNDSRIGYSNEAALLLVSQRSISILNSVIRSQGWGRQVESRHFRPNIVVSSEETFHDDDEISDAVNPEDFWERITIRGKSDDIELIARGKCARCQMVDIDPTSGVKGSTLRALALYRRDCGRINFGTFYTGHGQKERKHAIKKVVWLEVGDTVCCT